MKRYSRPVAAVAAAAMLASCATILHPERKGNRGGPVDVVPLVVDILLFIPGLIPGLIAIIVDFGTGAIYTGGGSADVPTDVPRHGKIAFRARDMPPHSKVELRLIDDEGTVLDADQVDGGDANRYGRLAVDLRHAARAHEGETDVPLTLEMRVDDKPPARMALVMR